MFLDLVDDEGATGTGAVGAIKDGDESVFIAKPLKEVFEGEEGEFVA